MCVLILLIVAMACVLGFKMAKWYLTRISLTLYFILCKNSLASVRQQEYLQMNHRKNFFSLQNRKIQLKNLLKLKLLIHTSYQLSNIMVSKIWRMPHKVLMTACFSQVSLPKTWKSLTKKFKKTHRSCPLIKSRLKNASPLYLWLIRSLRILKNNSNYLTLTKKWAKRRIFLCLRKKSQKAIWANFRLLISQI